VTHGSSLERNTPESYALAAGVRAGGIYRRAYKAQGGPLLFVLSVLAVVPLAALVSQAKQSIASKTGDSVGGLRSATLGKLTELVIALAAL
jgi:Ca2+/H+ antiporter